MRILRDSWHANLYQFWVSVSKGREESSCQPVSICKYVRGIVFAVVCVAAFYSCILGLCVWAVIEIWNDPMVVVRSVLVLVAIAAVVLLLFGLFIVYDKLHDWRYSVRLKRSMGTHKSAGDTAGLFRAWLKAKSQKFCPMIEFVEAEDSE